ncbi:thermonuclease family protein [Amycolatopsis alkalitolerans]|uniref:TNase-like domain-containing protein n=1 Tax=Amycolatopsis alkalitolerans TaxID=2547244 RepID=A0A5C4M864_9PSEU|nr:hypothetical protein [Amycolatopsis alkalitolerans]TNC27396.1 hypothetical protein FG385_10015 [Amycolatopsis alkalitolerans]
MRKRRVPTWLKVTLGAFVLLFAVATIVGRPATPGNAALSGVAASAPTTTSPPVTTYTVTGVDGDLIHLTTVDGRQTSVRAAGIALPLATNCYSVETASWAGSFLIGKQITMKTLETPTGTVAFITLDDGANYSTIALQSGYAKYAPDALSAGYGPALEAAETAARTGGKGLWGPPCNGNIDAPAPSSAPSTATEPVAQAGSTVPPGPVTTRRTTTTTPPPDCPRPPHAVDHGKPCGR